MADIYDVEISVVSQKGTCDACHKVGDKWIVKDTTPGGICIAAYYAMYPGICVLKYGGGLPWNQNPYVDLTTCPDTANPVVFELKRVKKE
jgi:uncharacterized repeat protein (TIGR04076 family)